MKEGRRSCSLEIVQFGIHEVRQLAGQGRYVGRKDLSFAEREKAVFVGFGPREQVERIRAEELEHGTCSNCGKGKSREELESEMVHALGSGRTVGTVVVLQKRT